MVAYFDRQYPSKSSRQYWLNKRRQQNERKKQARVRRRFAWQIKQRDEWACSYCGMRPKFLTIDHAIPRAKGGVTSWENCFSCCYSCNQSKRDKDLWEWWMRQPFWCETRAQRVILLMT